MPIKFLNTCIIILSLISIVSSRSLHAQETAIDEKLIAQVEHDTFKYFLTFTPRKTGLTKDSSSPGAPCSIAAVGFYLAALPVAVENQWLTKEDAFARAHCTLNTLLKKVHREKGFFYHFIDAYTGKRSWGSEVSSIDTALVIAGALLVGEYFKGSTVESLAEELYHGVEWPWMLNKGKQFSHGYKPETGFLPYYWDTYSEHIILQALGIGSPSHPVPAEVWNAWERTETVVNKKRLIFCFSGSLFTYQFSHAFIDFRTLSDNGINYSDNSRYATELNKSFCMAQAPHYATYRNGYWGLTASLGPRGYKAYGAEPGKAYHDGTIAPYGALSSMPFTPEESFKALSSMYTELKPQLYGTYGFRDAFNLDKQWFARDYIAIDQGITILMLENYRTGLIWKYFMRLKPIQQWISLSQLTPATPPSHPPLTKSQE